VSTDSIGTVLRLTPDFPCWSGSFASCARRLRTTTGPVLHQFEALFSIWIPSWRLAQQEEGGHSRDRQWNLRLVFWTFLWQIAQAGASCREAIRQAQALCHSIGRQAPADKNSPYVQARAQLPPQLLQDIHDAVVREAEAAVAEKDLWCGARVFAVDGCTVTAPDTPANQAAYPQQSVQAPGCGFPILRIVALLSMATGALMSWATGHWRQSELALLQDILWDCLRPGDVLLGDRGFCNWGLLAQCVHRDIEAVFRVKGKNRRDFRRGQRISRCERIVHWTKPYHRAATLSADEWALLPECLTLRLICCVLKRPGFRTQKVILVTTLLDSDQYPPAALGNLYLRRWTMELTLRNLKTTLQMDELSCKTPDNLALEIRMHFLLHNLIRRLMLEAARHHGAPLARLSFAGSLAAARRYSEAMLRARSRRQRRNLFIEVLRVIADDRVPDRPGRREPRALKRRQKPYPHLTRHRRRFHEIQHQNRYYANSPCGPRYR
jgi:hypothetical protein